MPLKDVLKTLRYKAGYTQSQLAERIGISTQGYQKYEYGQAMPAPDKIKPLAEALNVTSEHLLAIINKPSTPGGDVRVDRTAQMIDVPILSREVVACCGRGQPVLDITSPAEPGIQIPRSLLHQINKTLLTKTLHLLGYAPAEMSAHGFRSVGSTLLNEMGWPPDAIEAQLAHSVGGTVRAVYNHAQYLPIRRVMMQWYADYLDALRDGRPAPPMPPH